MSIKAGIVIDDWKLNIFEHRLSKSGFEFKQTSGPAGGLITLTIETSEINKLHNAVKMANREAYVSRLNPNDNIH